MLNLTVTWWWQLDVCFLISFAAALLKASRALVLILGLQGLCLCYRDRGSAEWCEELSFIFSYSLNFLIKIQLLCQSNSLQLLIQLLHRLSSMCSVLWCTLALSASFESAAWWCQYFSRTTGGADEWDYDESIAHWCKDEWHANGEGVPYCLLINPLRDIFTSFLAQLAYLHFLNWFLVPHLFLSFTAAKNDFTWLTPLHCDLYFLAHAFDIFLCQCCATLWGFF